MKRAYVGVVVVLLVISLFLTNHLLVPQIQQVLNNPPIIDSFNPSNNNLEIIEGDSVSFHISASDVDDDQLSYTWTLFNSVVSTDEGTSSSFTYNSKQGDDGQQIIQCIVTDGKEGIANIEWEVVVHYIRLSINVNVEEEGWIRDNNTDLPECKFIASFSIFNSGDIVAENVQINILLNEQSISTELISIPSNNEYSSNLPLILQYDTINTITIQASNEHSSNFKENILSARLERWPISSNLRRLYITPDDAIIKSKINVIFNEKPWWDIRPDWQVIYDWVNNYIDYEYDSVHFDEEYWQLPQETINRGKGDCEDQAVLLCSLLRARGYSSNDVFVILGYPEGSGSGHAWVTFKVFDIFGIVDYWQYLEATSSGWESEVAEFFSQILGYYESDYGSDRVYFNDLTYQTN